MLHFSARNKYGLRDHILAARREAFVRQFCRKLLGFALADEPLLAEMQAALRAHDHRIGVAIDAIVLSRPFREIRGQDHPDAD